MENIRVVVTGMGAVSCFGAGTDKLWQGVKDKRTGRRNIDAFPTARYRSPFAAQVPWDSLTAEQFHASLPEVQEKTTRIAKLAMTEAFERAGLSPGQRASAGCVVGSLCSGGAILEQYSRMFHALPARSEEPFPDTDACLVASQLETLVQHFGLNGPSTLISTACSSSTDAIGYALDTIRSGEATVMVAGGADVLSEGVHAGFNSAFSITTDHARPFDKSRSGFFIGEGAGMLVLESLDSALARGAHIHAEVIGYGLSNAAFHLTATSSDAHGESLAVRRCLTDGGIAPAKVTYVNAHGTATKHNDQTEVKAMHTVFGDHARNIAISSIKPNIGHCMGAAGALEAIMTIYCIEHGFVPPMIETSGDIDDGLRFAVDEGIHMKIDYAISQSFGFGGACSATLLGAFR